MAIKGFATLGGTKRFSSRYNTSPDFWSVSNGMYMSSLGVGTYLGEADERVDSMYESALKAALENGLNVLDTAINYRYQRSERSLGKVLKELTDNGFLNRDEVVLCTKGGFVTGDGKPPTNDFLYDKYIGSGIIKPQEIVAGAHCMKREFIRDQFESSLKNLCIEAIDVYYIHNPETQVSFVSYTEFARRLTEVFGFFEELVESGKLKSYGTATWNAYRVNKDNRDYLPIELVKRCAEEAGGKQNNFKYIQLPYNMLMHEAYTSKNQEVLGVDMTIFDAAEQLGLTVVTSASIGQGQLFDRVTLEEMEGIKSKSQILLQFSRSAQGVTTSLCGMKNVGHVAENSGVKNFPKIKPEKYNLKIGMDK